ncbi:MAG: spore germination protein [Negativicutes bacterium]|nr:spore germination protein [Negativicutes bacterium]
MELNRWVSPLQFMVITINTMIGANLLTLPRTIVATAKQDMWMSILVTSVLFAVSFRIAAALAAYFPNHTSIEYHRILLGRFFGNILNLIMLTLMLAVTAQFIRIFRIAVKIFLLDLTPSQVIVFIFLALAVYAAQHGLGPIIRVQQLLFLFSYSLFIMLILLGVLEVEREHYSPMLADGIKPVLQGSLNCWTAYSGPELIIGFLYPYLVQRERITRYGLIVIGAVTIIYVLIYGITLGILGAAETADLLIPTVMAYRSIEIPDTFIERIDGYLMIVWIAICFTSLLNWLYFIGFGAARMLKLESSRAAMVLLLPLISYLVALPPDYHSFVTASDWINYCSLIWGLGFMPMLLILAWRRKAEMKQCTKD